MNQENENEQETAMQGWKILLFIVVVWVIVEVVFLICC